MAKKATSARRAVSQGSALYARALAWIAEDARWGKAENDLEIAEWDIQEAVAIPDCIKANLPPCPARPDGWTRAMTAEEIEQVHAGGGSREAYDQRMAARAKYDRDVQTALEAAGLAKKRAEHEAWDRRRYDELTAILATPSMDVGDVLAKVVLGDVFGMWTTTHKGDLESNCMTAALRDLHTLAGVPRPKRWRYYPEAA